MEDGHFEPALDSAHYLVSHLGSTVHDSSCVTIITSPYHFFLRRICCLSRITPLQAQERYINLLRPGRLEGLGLFFYVFSHNRRPSINGFHRPVPCEKGGNIFNYQTFLTKTPGRSMDHFHCNFLNSFFSTLPTRLLGRAFIKPTSLGTRKLVSFVWQYSMISSAVAVCPGLKTTKALIFSP